MYGPYYTGGAAVSGLDDCGGREEEIAALDGFKYRYYFTGELSNLYALPGHPKPAAADYPFAFKCYKGCTWDLLSAGSCSGDSGVASGYTATTTTGYTTPFAQYGSSSATNFKGETYQSAFISSGKCTSSSSSGASSSSQSTSALAVYAAMLVSVLQINW